MNEDNSDTLVVFKSWDDFGRSMWSKSLHEPERNMVIRFQWTPDNRVQFAVFQLCVGRLMIFDIGVKQEEEVAIRRWLAEQYRQLVQQWKPITARG